MATKYHDFSGKRIHKLVVTEFSESRTMPKSGRKQMYWLCKCDCGNEKWISSCHLAKEHAKSCGCFNIEKHSAPFGMATQRNIYYDYLYNANRRGIELELSFEEFIEIASKKCYYCNREPDRVEKSKYNNGDFIFSGVDRLDSSLDYTIANCVPCCSKCNVAKNALTYKEFLELVENIYNNRIKNEIT